MAVLIIIFTHISTVTLSEFFKFQPSTLGGSGCVRFVCMSPLSPTQWGGFDLARVTSQNVN